MNYTKLKFYISPKGLHVKLAKNKAYLVSGVKICTIKDLLTKEKRNILIFN
jgi:hypothetical protein